ncbi:Spectrin alpha chain [Papilio machaon]|uniref:Spectrin alpha chain n=1 Tax=Papilio machaon TaxID=76193 RepID=A0A194QW47_PAPMA|nr:Spectrin alpha chain [Papilio machaon]
MAFVNQNKRIYECSMLQQCHNMYCNMYCNMCVVFIRTSMMEGTGSLEQQLAALRQRAGEVRARRADLRRLEELGMSYILQTRYNIRRKQED